MRHVVQTLIPLILAAGLPLTAQTRELDLRLISAGLPARTVQGSRMDAPLGLPYSYYARQTLTSQAAQGLGVQMLWQSGFQSTRTDVWWLCGLSQVQGHSATATQYRVDNLVVSAEVRTGQRVTVTSLAFGAAWVSRGPLRGGLGVEGRMERIQDGSLPSGNVLEGSDTVLRPWIKGLVRFQPSGQGRWVLGGEINLAVDPNPSKGLAEGLPRWAWALSAGHRF